jgi:hypothetical protein
MLQNGRMQCAPTKLAKIAGGQYMSNWQLVKFGNVAKLNYGKALNTEDRIDGDVPVADNSNVQNLHIAGLILDKIRAAS